MINFFGGGQALVNLQLNLVVKCAHTAATFTDVKNDRYPGPSGPRYCTSIIIIHVPVPD